MQIHELRPPRGAKKARKRVGRGNASGQGTYAGKGLKGQQARAGSGPSAAFEGGQTPLVRRLPRRRGFHNPFRTEYAPVNLRDLARFPANSEVTPETLRESGLVRSLRLPIKVLGDGELSAALTVRTHRVSAAARAKIEAAGGTVEELTPAVPKEERQRKRKHLRVERPAKAEEEAPEAEAAEKESNDGDSETASDEGAGTD